MFRKPRGRCRKRRTPTTIRRECGVHGARTLRKEVNVGRLVSPFTAAPAGEASIAKEGRDLVVAGARVVAAHGDEMVGEGAVEAEETHEIRLPHGALIGQAM